MKKILLPLLFLCANLAAAVPGFDREGVFLRDFPYTPADGAVLSYNPSAFAFVRPDGRTRTVEFAPEIHVTER